MMMRILSIKPHSPEWHEARRKFIGGSDIPILMGKSRYGLTSEDLLLSKKGLKIQEESWAMKRGTELEPRALACFEFEQGLELEREVTALDAYIDHYGVSFDGISKDHKVVVEAKCPMSLKSMEAASKYCKNCLGEYRPDYRCQVQWQLMISKARIGYLIFYHPDCDCVLFEEYPDENLWLEMQKAADRFWSDLNMDSQAVDF